jgi:hypothetical protein
VYGSQDSCPSRTGEREGKRCCVKGGVRDKEKYMLERVRRIVRLISSTDWDL